MDMRRSSPPEELIIVGNAIKPLA